MTREAKSCSGRARNWSLPIAKARSTNWSSSRLNSSSTETIRLELTKPMQKQWIVKKANQPLGHQSAGCIFKNPRGVSAGMLIEQAGLKNARVGQAEVSERHANFIIADQGATSDDVLKLIELVRERVLDRLGIELETEIEIW